MGDRYSGRGSLRRSPPPRDRFPARDRDDHPDVEYFGAGESYRPGGSAGEGPYRPPRERERDRDRDFRAPDRRDDRRRDDIDSYIPPTSARAHRARSRSPAAQRRRSRSPPARPGRPELFPERARSPPRRFSPSRDERARSPPRRRSRSPYNARGRSPIEKRPRDFSTDGRRSPKREKVDSPPPRNRFDRPRSPPRRALSPPRNGAGAYRPRSRSPPRRDDRRPNYADENWRRRSPSPRASGPVSGDTSRRSSPPPIHPDRASLAGSRPHSPAFAPRSTNDYPARPRSPRADYRDRSQEPASREDYSRSEAGAAPPSGPRGTSYDRPPPTGPSRTYSSQTSPAPGSAPSTAPSAPRGRGAPGRFEQPSRDFSSPPGAVRGRTSLTYRAPGYRPPSYSDAPPAGPRAPSYSGRGDFNGPSRGDYSSPRGGYGRGASSYSPNTEFPFRASNNSTSTTYPRSQRFNTTTSHLASLEKIVPGGKRLSNGLSAEQEKKMKQLEEDAEKMRQDMVEKQRSKREALNEWEVRERETELAALRSELAEDHLRKLTEEDAIAGAAF